MNNRFAPSGFPGAKSEPFGRRALKNRDFSTRPTRARLRYALLLLLLSTVPLQAQESELLWRGTWSHEVVTDGITLHQASFEGMSNRPCISLHLSFCLLSLVLLSSVQRCMPVSIHSPTVHPLCAWWAHHN